MRSSRSSAEAESTRVTVAGRRGDDVRSDLHVSFEPRAEGVTLEVTSRVEAYYGQSIRDQALEVLSALGVAGCSCPATVHTEMAAIQKLIRINFRTAAADPSPSA